MILPSFREFEDSLEKNNNCGQFMTESTRCLRLGAARLPLLQHRQHMDSFRIHTFVHLLRTTAFPLPPPLLPSAACDPRTHTGELSVVIPSTPYRIDSVSRPKGLPNWPSINLFPRLFLGSPPLTPCSQISLATITIAIATAQIAH